MRAAQSRGIRPLPVNGSPSAPGVALDVGDGTTLTISGVPCAVGDTVLAAEPLRHGLANAATGGIWRVRGPAGLGDPQGRPASGPGGAAESLADQR